MNPKTERFEMRLDPETLGRLDEWRGDQMDLPSRAEAVRRLMETGLSANEESRIVLSDGEKLIIHMLCDLTQKRKPQEGIDPKFVEEALWGGHYWALKWQYPGVFETTIDDEQLVHEVGDMMEVWWFLEPSYEQLSDEDKARVETEADPLGKDVRFRGFDGNNEGRYLSIARFYVEQMERFELFKGRDFNSHFPMVDTYRRMVQVFKPMRVNIGPGWLSADQIIKLLNAQKHPSRR